MSCKHRKLTMKDPIFTGYEMTMEDKREKPERFLPDYFMYRLYRCEECGRTIIILHAIVGKETENGAVSTQVR